MKIRRSLALAIAFSVTLSLEAGEQTLEPLHLEDAAWMKDVGDRLARCAGTYRGAAEVMRRSGREQAASYADAVASGALFAAYVLFTSPAALNAKVLDNVDANVHIEALAWGYKQNFIMASEGAETGLTDTLRSCTATSALQSAILRSLTV